MRVGFRFTTQTLQFLSSGEKRLGYFKPRDCGAGERGLLGERAGAAICLGAVRSEPDLAPHVFD
jgi:hypothetical protein